MCVCARVFMCLYILDELQSADGKKKNIYKENRDAYWQQPVICMPWWSADIKLPGVDKLVLTRRRANIDR